MQGVGTHVLALSRMKSVHESIRKKDPGLMLTANGVTCCQDALEQTAHENELASWRLARMLGVARAASSGHRRKETRFGGQGSRADGDMALSFQGPFVFPTRAAESPPPPAQELQARLRDVEAQLARRRAQHPKQVAAPGISKPCVSAESLV